MTPEQLIYDRLSTATDLQGLIGDRLYPSTPPTNTQVPFAVYTVSAADPTLTTTGPSNLSRYSVEVDAWGVDLSSVLAVLGAAKARLNGWRGGSVQGCFWSSYSTDEQDTGYHGQASYTLWVDQAAIIPPSTPQALISTGHNYITLRACDHTLTLDCNGLTLDGLPPQGEQGPPGPNTVDTSTGTPLEGYLKGDGERVYATNYIPWEDVNYDLSQYARLDTDNHFSGDQIVHGDLMVYGIGFTFAVRSDGIELPELDDSEAGDKRLYYSTTQNKLAYKDSSGTVRTFW